MSMSIIYMKNIYNALAAAMIMLMIWVISTNSDLNRKQRIITRIRIDYMQKGIFLMIVGFKMLFFGKFMVSMLGLDFFDSRKAKIIGAAISITITLLFAKWFIQFFIRGTSAIRRSLILWYAQRHSAKRHRYDIKKLTKWLRERGESKYYG